jgi:hypothetical protein
MKNIGTAQHGERPGIDPQRVAGAMQRARVLRAQAFTRAFCAPWHGLRSRVDAARRAAGAALHAGA